MDKPQKRAREVEAKTRDEDQDETGIASLSRPISPPLKKQRQTTRRTVRSPWQLTWIRDLPESLNRDAVTLEDLLGDPLIYECWEFNYLHDVDFLMAAFDNDTRHLVKVHIVHGFWKRDDPNRLQLQVRLQFPLHAFIEYSLTAQQGIYSLLAFLVFFFFSFENC